jgi:hypothetical protein
LNILQGSQNPAWTDGDARRFSVAEIAFNGLVCHRIHRDNPIRAGPHATLATDTLLLVDHDDILFFIRGNGLNRAGLLAPWNFTLLAGHRNIEPRSQ